MELLILAANGQIAQIVTERIMNEETFKDVELTLFLRNSQRLSSRWSNKANFFEGSLDDSEAIKEAMAGQDVVFVGAVDHTSQNTWTKNIISAMKANNVNRVIFSNILGLYNEVPGEFGRWNMQQVKSGLPAAIRSDQLLAESGLNYTTLRLPWLNNRDEIKYVITHQGESYNGVSGSRQSVADLVLKLITDSELGAKESLGLADPDTQGSDRPVY